MFLKNLALIYIFTLTLLNISCLSSPSNDPILSKECISTIADERLKFEMGETLSFPLDSLTSTNSTCVQLFIQPGADKEYLTFLDQQNHCIHFYDFGKRVQDFKISFEKEGPNGVGDIINGYLIHNMDSIFIISRYNIYIVNRDGKPFYKYSLLDNNSYEFTSLPQVTTSQPAVFKDGVLFMNAFPDKDLFSLDTFYGSQCKIILDLKSNKFEYDLSYPNSYTKGIYGPNFMFTYNTFNSITNKFIYSFPADECIYETNHKDFFTNHYGGSSLNVKPMTKPIRDYEGYTKFYVTSPSYSHIYHNKYENIYYRFIEDARSNEDYEEGRRWKIKTVTLLDSAFLKVGEMEIDENLSPHMSFITPNGFYLIRGTSSEDSLYFSQLKFSEK